LLWCDLLAIGIGGELSVYQFWPIHVGITKQIK